MELIDAIKCRHSVRNYQDKELSKEIVSELQKEISLLNQKESCSIQLITQDKDVFTGLLAHYGGFRKVSNYIALVGPKSDDLQKKLGYAGELLVLKAQQLGLNTCWVAATYKKGKCKAVVRDQEDLVCILALGYGTTQGVPHKSKPIHQLYKAQGTLPEWFIKGLEAAMLAPTAMNKQNFCIALVEGEVQFEAKKGLYTQVDLGIVQCHFEIGVQAYQQNQ